MRKLLLLACLVGCSGSGSSGGGGQTPPAATCQGADCPKDQASQGQGTDPEVALALDKVLPTSPAFTVIHADSASSQPTDLAFSRANPNQLWVVRYKVLSTLLITNAGAENQDVKVITDPAAAHFARKTPALAWGDANTWGTCGDNTNPEGGNNLFMGPSLFSGDLEIFGKATPQGLGSHLDMLHHTPLCRGIEHEQKNIYWLFNAYDKAIDKYDFRNDHGPGNDDHSDGEVWRYAKDAVLGKDGVPSHLALSAADGMLYIADTGHGRVARLDTKSGTQGSKLPRQLEPMAGRYYMNDAVIEDFVPPGTIDAPSGIEFHKDIVYVSDNATSKFFAFDKSGKLLRTLETGLPEGALAGFTFGPDGRIWFVDMAGSRILRIDAAD